jgi:hypothetical protein
MQLLIILALAGVVSGLVGGAFTGGMEEMLLGSVSGLVLGVLSWTVSGTVLRVVREYRLNQHFYQENSDQE